MKKTHITKGDIFSPFFATDGETITMNEGSLDVGAGLRPSIELATLEPGADYYLQQVDGRILGIRAVGLPVSGTLGGFHVGLDGKIVPGSIWDSQFRPAAADPRAMVFVGSFWVDIYLLNTRPHTFGTSAAGQTIADGHSGIEVGETPQPLSWWVAVSILAKHGKQLLSKSEFFLMAQGVEDGKTAGNDPIVTGHAPGLKSRYGVEQATGCMWTWGRDADTGDTYVSVFGGDWVSFAAGPRRSDSSGPGGDWANIGARGRCDHLILA